MMSWFGQLRDLSAVHRLRGDENGASLLEMTVVTPFLLALGLGVFEFSNALYQYHLITAGVRDAARFAAGLPMPDPVVTTDVTCDESDPWSTPIGCAKRLAVTGQIESDGTNRIDWWNVEDITIEYPEVTNENLDGDLRSYRGGSEIITVQVSTTFTYDGLGFLSYFGIDPITITTAHEERHYGVR